MSKYDGIVQMAKSLGSRAGSTAGTSKYPWKVQDQATAGAKWKNSNRYTKMLRSYASQGIQQYTENPTAYTPEMEKDVTNQYIDTSNAQADKAADQFKTNMARTGLAGQPVVAANEAQVDYQRGKDIAGKVTDTKTQFAVQRQEDYEDWLDRIQQLNAQDRQFKLERDKMAMQMAQFNAARGDQKREEGRFENKFMRWANPIGGLLGALGSKSSGQKG